MLTRKIDSFLKEWKYKTNKKPLIISGARQIGKTTSIRLFGKQYKSFIEINFITSPEYKSIFDNGFEVEEILKAISLLNPNSKFIENDTLILFDEIQSYPDAVTSLKPFSLDGRFDVICSGSLLGVNYKSIQSIPVGFKEECQMYSMDFEEFLWAKGYSCEQIEEYYSFLKDLKSLPQTHINVIEKLYREYIFVGGMPEAVQKFIDTNSYSDVFAIQKQIYKDYEGDIIKYVEGLDAAKVKNIYHHISSQLAKDNHKFQITKLSHGARAREYVGTQEWLRDAGIINIAYNIQSLSLPLSGNEIMDYFRIYYSDHSLFIANLDEEAKDDLIKNGNFNIQNGALYESLVSEALVKSGYELFFYKTNDATIELDFLVRSKNEIIPIEVKKSNGRSKSLQAVINGDDNCITHGVKLIKGNIGFDGKIITIPYALSFMLKRFLKETDITKW